MSNTLYCNLKREAHKKQHKEMLDSQKSEEASSQKSGKLKDNKKTKK